ncbi:CBS domain-containing protein [Methanohalophilus halophilus]|uniref:CBS domain-containing protein n=1 Tax=Methanohalophilus halophilus TaxID=2177 RepID=A0A1L3Q175_9EURY|nr:CBS domain-containing protein [Methanohalophilus halophilus]APH38622.1 CBS domain-containing protein [Methanohalophilus halophilus]RNI08379.1 CBS domain-containing protein [Methanohalophilus halophilus]
MSEDAVYLHESDTVTHARQLMRDYFLRGIPVVNDNGKVLGMITDQDILKVASTKSNVTVAGFVSPVPQITPETDIYKAASLLLEAKLERCPVVKSTIEQNLAGIVSNTDLLGKMVSRDLSKSVREIMTSPVTTCTPKDNIGEIWAAMLENDYTGLPVISKKNKLMGMVTRRDLIKSGFARIGVREKNGSIHNQPVEKVMSTPAYSIKQDTSVKECTEKVLHYDIGRLTVAVEDKPVGIVDRSDLLRAYTE